MKPDPNAIASKICALDERARDVFAGRVTRGLPTQAEYAELFYERYAARGDWDRINFTDHLDERSDVSAPLPPHSLHDKVERAKEGVHLWTDLLVATERQWEALGGSAPADWSLADGWHDPVVPPPFNQLNLMQHDGYKSIRFLGYDVRGWWGSEEVTVSQLATYATKRLREAERAVEKERFDAMRTSTQLWAHSKALRLYTDVGGFPPWEEVPDRPQPESPLPLPYLDSEVDFGKKSASHLPFEEWIVRAFNALVARKPLDEEGRRVYPKADMYWCVAAAHVEAHGALMRRYTHYNGPLRCRGQNLSHDLKLLDGEAVGVPAETVRKFVAKARTRGKIKDGW